MGKKLGETFLKERYTKDEQYFRVYDTYRPNYFRAIVTGKFYARHEQLDLTKADESIVDAIKTAKQKLPRQRYAQPVTSTHEYGWYDPLVTPDRCDRRFFAPQRNSPFIEHEINLRRDRTMKKEKFTGIPFKL